MAEETGTKGPKDKPRRRARGFQRAGVLIEPQIRSATAQRGYAQARLRALWPEIAGAEIAAVTTPVKLATARGPSGGLLTLAVASAHGPQVQMLLPLIRDRVNAAIGPGAVGRIQITQGAPAGFAEPQGRFVRDQPPQPARDLGALGPVLSSIGDDELRAALKTLAQNVLSKSQTTEPPES